MRTLATILGAFAVLLIAVSDVPAASGGVQGHGPPVQPVRDVDRPANGIYQHLLTQSMPAGSTGFSFEFPNVAPGTLLTVQYVSVRLPSLPEPSPASCLLNLKTSTGTASFHLPIFLEPAYSGEFPRVAFSLTGYHSDPDTPPLLACTFGPSSTLSGADATLVGYVVDL